jgi:Ca2+-binding RTX toxin-like protein
MAHHDGSTANNYIDMIGYGNSNDIVHPGAGNDTVFGWNGNDVIDDMVNDAGQGSGGNDTFYGEAGNDKLYGWTGNDWLYGGADGDTLFGEDGLDILYGEGGNDLLHGGQGKDYLYGGANDHDTFDFDNASESSEAVPDYIGGFDFGLTTTGDKIDVSGIDAKTGFFDFGNQAFTWGGTTSKGKGYLYAESYGAKDTIIKGNTDSDSYAEFAVVVHDKNPGSWLAIDFVL